MASVPPSTWFLSTNSINLTTSSSASSSTILFFPRKNLRSRQFFGPSRTSASSADSSSETAPDEESPAADPVKLALAKAKAYQKSKVSKPTPAKDPVAESSDVSKGGGDPGPAVPDSVKLAMERAREYKKNKGSVGGVGDVAAEKPGDTGLQKMKAGKQTDVVAVNKVKKRGELTVSSLDFLGLNFSDKKNSRGPPAGLVPTVDPFGDRDLPEVEIIVGDYSNFHSSEQITPNSDEDDDKSGIYKPKVSTWGVFPRPSNISQTFGGGRNICPGQELETAEVKAAKQERTKQLIASYKNQIGLSIDAKTRSKCEKALKEGDYLMDLGKLREALPYYERVMKDLVFQTELHGIAALQWSICQDSLCRPNEARVMYEKLQSHPNVQVSKKAKQFIFGFQAMEMMRISSSLMPKNTGYENYFDAFLDDKGYYTSTAEVEGDEGALRQVLPYIILLLTPIFMVLVIAVRKASEI